MSHHSLWKESQLTYLLNTGVRIWFHTVLKLSDLVPNHLSATYNIFAQSFLFNYRITNLQNERFEYDFLKSKIFSRNFVLELPSIILSFRFLLIVGLRAHCFIQPPILFRSCSYESNVELLDSLGRLFAHSNPGVQSCCAVEVT